MACEDVSSEKLQNIYFLESLTTFKKNITLIYETTTNYKRFSYPIENI